MRNKLQFLFVALACFALASCGKEPSSRGDKQPWLDWNLKTTVAAYQQAGKTNPKWDGPAKAALTEFVRSHCGVVAAGENFSEVISTNCAAAVAAGCDDPLIRYLNIRFNLSPTNSPQGFAKAFCDVARDLQKTSYPSIRKFYAAIRAVDQLVYTYGTNAVARPALDEVQPMVAGNLYPTIQDKTLPPEEVYLVCTEALRELKADPSLYAQAYYSLEAIVFTNWPNESASWLLKGGAFLDMAWNARGGGYSSGISQNRWAPFFDKLSVSESALKKAWLLDPHDARIPTLMIRVDEGQQKKRNDMELWFGRAMALDPKNYEACKNKLHYLYPQWYGSREDMLAFGRECVASTNWTGSVPLILVDAHWEYALFSLETDQARQAYWKRPEVWRDIKAGYERFFALNPGFTDYYKNYAWYAYHAGQWGVVNELIPKIRPEDYDYFGGKAEFDTMVELTKKNVKSGAPER